MCCCFSLRRGAELDASKSSSLDFRRNDFLKRGNSEFLLRMSGREITSCTPDDIRRFSVWKDQSVKVKFIRFITVFYEQGDI